jgi:hypothetical protein
MNQLTKEDLEKEATLDEQQVSKKKNQQVSQKKIEATLDEQQVGTA